MGKPLAIVAGAGAGLGQSLLKRFEAGGMVAVGLSRSPDNSDLDIRACDLSHSENAQATLAEIMAQHGAPKIVVHNTASLVIKPFLETEPQDFRNCWNNMVQTAVTLGQSVLPAMIETGGGFIVSGATASLRGGNRFAAFTSAKFALRGLTQSLAREFQPQGIHVVHTILDGIIDSQRSRDLHGMDPAKMMNPDELAEAYWHLAHQPKSVWTHEADFRPQSESF